MEHNVTAPPQCKMISKLNLSSFQWQLKLPLLVLQLSTWRALKWVYVTNLPEQVKQDHAVDRTLKHQRDFSASKDAEVSQRTYNGDKSYKLSKENMK